ncbi:TAXI family TRAP transporter solute-binding subunit [Bradyrhizobium sp. P5_C11_2]
MFEQFRRRIRKHEWRIGAAALLLAAGTTLIAIGYWYFTSPTVFTVAVGPPGSTEMRLVQAFADALVEQKKDVRLRIVPFSNVRQSAEALQQKSVDLAIVRPDVFLPDDGLTLSIVREEAVLLLAPASSNVKAVSDLVGKQLGLVLRHDADLSTVTSILAHYNLMPPQLALVPLKSDEVEAALTARTIDAVAFIAAPASPEAAHLAQIAIKTSGEHVSIVPFEQAQALALKSPALTAMTVPGGSLNGRPEVPAEDVKTIGASYRLMARSGLDRAPVSKVIQYLFQMRSRIARADPAINLMRAPDNDTITSAALPNHPGAVDYLNREQESFMDRYGDWLWLLLFAGGGISSALAWVSEIFARKRRELVDEVLDRLTCLLSEVRSARTPGELASLTEEVDTLVTHAIRYARYRVTNTRALSALILAIDSTRSAIGDRRCEMLGEVARLHTPATKSAHKLFFQSGDAEL